MLPIKRYCHIRFVIVLLGIALGFVSLNAQANNDVNTFKTSYFTVELKDDWENSAPVKTIENVMITSFTNKKDGVVFSIMFIKSEQTNSLLQAQAAHQSYVARNQDVSELKQKQDIHYFTINNNGMPSLFYSQSDNDVIINILIMGNVQSAAEFIDNFNSAITIKSFIPSSLQNNEDDDFTLP